MNVQQYEMFIRLSDYQLEKGKEKRIEQNRYIKEKTNDTMRDECAERGRKKREECGEERETFILMMNYLD